MFFLKTVVGVSLFFLILGCTGGNQNEQVNKPSASKAKGEPMSFKFDQELFSDPFKNEKSQSARTLLKELMSEKENKVFSPLSLEAVLTLLAAGANGQSLEDLKSFLQLESEKPVDHLQYMEASFDYMMNGRPRSAGDHAPEVSLGFGIAASQQHPIDAEAVEALQKQVDVYLKSFDFKNNADQATKEINQWVAEKTNQKIKKLLAQIQPETAMILLNTLYFKSPWLEPFKEGQTKPMDFTTESGEKIKVSMMNRGSFYSYVDHSVFQGVSIPLNVSDMQFWFLRPKTTVAELIDHLSSHDLKSQLSRPKHQDIDLSLPKFKIETKLKLIEVLKRHGLEILTRSPNLEINGFFAEKKDFIVSEAIQGNYFAIDEKGVEAASATALGMRAGSAPPKDGPIELKFDKPFVFLMYQLSTGRIAFAGQVYMPETP